MVMCLHLAAMLTFTLPSYQRPMLWPLKRLHCFFPVYFIMDSVASAPSITALLLSVWDSFDILLTNQISIALILCSHISTESGVIVLVSLTMHTSALIHHNKDSSTEFNINKYL